MNVVIRYVREVRMCLLISAQNSSLSFDDIHLDSPEEDSLARNV